MVLQPDRAAGARRVVPSGLEPLGRSPEADAVLDEHAVLEGGDPRGLDQGALRIEAGAPEDDVIGLPFPRGERGIDQGRVLPVGGAGLAVGISVVVVGVEHLQFVGAHQEHPAVAPSLPRVVRRRRGGPLDVQLDVAEIPPGVDVPRPGHRLHRPVPHHPSRRISLPVPPCVEAAAVEEDEGVGGGRDRLCGRAGGHHRWKGPGRILGPPAGGGLGQEGGSTGEERCGREHRARHVEPPAAGRLRRSSTHSPSWTTAPSWFRSSTDRVTSPRRGWAVSRRLETRRWSVTSSPR